MNNSLYFSQKIITWYRNTNTQQFPWQLNKTIYSIWISEIMLQQTQVNTVIPYYKKFIDIFPTIQQLAMAELNEILYIWSGLGYYRRAVHLHQTAKIVVKQYNSQFPQNFDILLSLPGIGKSTAGAILSLALNKRYPILDGNIKRILIRYYLIHNTLTPSKINNQLWSLIDQLMPHTNIAIFNQAMMDLGRLICTYTKPSCNICPINENCKAFINNQINLNLIKTVSQKSLQKTVWWLILLLKNSKTVWLKKRVIEKIWTGLFCFPEFHNIDMLNIWISDHNISHLKKRFHIPILKHNISNINLTIYPILININTKFSLNNEEGIWLNLNKISIIGIPKPVSILLKKLKIYTYSE